MAQPSAHSCLRQQAYMYLTAGLRTNGDHMP